MSLLDRFKKTDKKPADKDFPVEDQLPTEKEVDSKNEPAQVKSVSKKSVSQKTKKEIKKSGSGSHESYGVLVKPLITEKASDLTQFNKYVFAVSSKANKIQIARAIETRYGVKPIKVNVLNNIGRQVRYGRVTGRTKGWRKAIVTLPEGKSIQIQEGV